MAIFCGQLKAFTVDSVDIWTLFNLNISFVHHFIDCMLSIHNCSADFCSFADKQTNNHNMLQAWSPQFDNIDIELKEHSGQKQIQFWIWISFYLSLNSLELENKLNVNVIFHRFSSNVMLSYYYISETFSICVQNKSYFADVSFSVRSLYST